MNSDGYYPRIDLVGQKFGRLRVVELSGRTNSKAQWICECDCGIVIVVYGYNLSSGNSQSCGCLKIERTREANRTHSRSCSDTYRIYHGMLARCRKTTDAAYDRYGGRGIGVTERWKGRMGFENFLSDMGERPGEEYSLDRIDNDGNYGPENCRWATGRQQMLNTRRTVMVFWEGENTPLAQLCEGAGISTEAVRYRLRTGWQLDDALRMATKTQTDRKSLKARCRDRALPYNTIYRRVRLGWSVEEALTMPIRGHK